MGLVSFLLSEGQPPASPPLIQGQMAGLVGKKVVTAGSEVHSAVTCPPCCCHALRVGMPRPPVLSAAGQPFLPRPNFWLQFICLLLRLCFSCHQCKCTCLCLVVAFLGWCSLCMVVSPFVQFSSIAQLLCDSLRPHGLPHARLPCPSSTPAACSNSCPIESVIPSNHLILCPLLLPSIFPSIRVFSSESVLLIWWPKYWSFSFNISPSNEYSGLISFRMDWFDLLAGQGTLRNLQHHGSKTSVLRRSAFFMDQLSHLYMTAGKTIVTRQNFVGKVMSLLFNMLSRLVIAFLPRSRRLLISWLHLLFSPEESSFPVSCDLFLLRCPELGLPFGASPPVSFSSSSYLCLLLVSWSSLAVQVFTQRYWFSAVPTMLFMAASMNIHFVFISFYWNPACTFLL